MEKRIGFIGAGNMGGAIANTLVEKGYKEIKVSDKNPETWTNLKEKIETTTSNKYVVENSDIIILCVKPQHMDEVITEIKDYCKDKLVISIAAGKTLEYLENNIGHSRVTTAMPFMGVMYGYGATGYVCGKGCSVEDQKTVYNLFEKIGAVSMIPKENMEDMTAIASMPGWVIQYCDAMMGGLKLKKPFTKQCVAKVLRTCADVLESEEEPNEFYKRIASAGGTTEAGYEHAKQKGLYKIAKEMVNAAIKRYREL
ncbi:pyrroline-5-carboxylate reductase [Candidatus Woesearchaeota archaeon]|jgi:pyrroline-5-carboxylate reductase|nr:pyrroline-5-carboxylate reductase [Candidatus Woesearchaeota archaeon]MBT5273085.1 pyrroline-5-carboxylate reductase [Candidatus Woesearchaeota archaeon]MBT6040849.1 pyrroline-5-carboxylate reductase [Candidatus Woesearchaeota archaeon]MBT6337600.1 pyrroline-5-carboxylate reductase [Candidatus Woesearchaeota archaeon]MBT7926999.1 pyrroline-5-carboxylate reductase [Candidatus Woesearchaeota archaeon]